MSQENELPEDENFSDDPEENLRMQNDFLKMKMMAESGAIFGGDADLPPEIENQFLKNILEFEKVNADSKPVRIFEILGKPFFDDEKNLNSAQFRTEFTRLMDLLNNYSININFTKERDDRFKYNFITKELFNHETSFLPVKGMITYFSYEEFHPDHKQEITDITNHFLNDFFDRKLNTETDYINKELIEPDGTILSRESLMNRFYSLYDAAIEFENPSFILENVDFELKESHQQPFGMGFSEGTIHYEMIFDDATRKKISGPFKIYFTREYELWGICFFYLAGYNLHQKEEKN
jgi:hypothetical protein